MRTLSGGGSRQWDVEKDRFTARLVAHTLTAFKVTKGKDKGKTKHSYVLSFEDPKGERFERNSTTLWDNWLLGDKKMKQPPTLKVGDVIRVRKIEERGEWYSFTLDVFDGKDIPPAFRRK